MTNKFDCLLEQLGTGKWNFVGIIVVAYWSAMIPANSLGGAYLTPQMEHSCRIPPDGDPLTTTNSDTNETTIDACWYLKNTTNGTEKVACTDWNFDNSTYTSTLTSEFQLVCDYKFLRPTFGSVYFFGALFGAAINGWLSDSYGRKTMMTVGMVFYSILSNCINWLPNISSILVARFLMGLMHPTSTQSGFTLILEKCEPRYRSAVAFMSFLPWAFGISAWGGYAYLIKEWRWLMFVATLPAILHLPILWFIDESPRWLIVRGQHDRALQVLQRAARWNKTTLPPQEELLVLMKEIQMETNKEKNQIKGDTQGLLAFLKDITYETIILLRTRMIRRITLKVYTVFFVCGMVYYGLSLSGGMLQTDPFVYMALTGVMEIPSSTITIPMVNYMGRRPSNTLCFFITGISLMSLTFIPKGWIATTMALIGKICISSGYAIIYLQASELFPTEVRIRGLGTSGMVSKLGSVFAPYLIDTIGALYWWAPSVVCGGGSIVASVICFLLPETLGVALPDTITTLEKNTTFKKKEPADHKELDPLNPDEKVPMSN